MNQFTRTDTSRVIKAPTGRALTCKSWLSEAPYRMIQNNLHPDVAENPQSLVVYGGIGRAARNWECYDQILASLKQLEDDQTLLIQSGKPVGVFNTHENAPRVLIANSNLAPRWATWEHFNELGRKDLFILVHKASCRVLMRPLPKQGDSTLAQKKATKAPTTGKGVGF